MDGSSDLIWLLLKINTVGFITPRSVVQTYHPFLLVKMGSNPTPRTKPESISRRKKRHDSTFSLQGALYLMGLRAYDSIKWSENSCFSPITSPKCMKLEAMVKTTISTMGVDAEIIPIYDIDEILSRILIYLCFHPL